MRLLSCHIENFGRLHDLDVDFSSNPTVIFAENGWGKSTLSAFIKSMFYGLPDSRVKTTDNARKKYKPWQGGVYGGSLTFEKGEKRYVVQRIFGDGAKGDSCRIYDALTHLQTTDFPIGKDGLGEKLFGVDEEGYEKLVYMPQGSVESRLDGGLQAALLRSRESIGGSEDVEAAVERIEMEERLLRAKRKPAKGRLDVLDEQIFVLEEELFSAENSSIIWAQTQAKIGAIDEEIAKNKDGSILSLQERYAAQLAIVQERRKGAIQQGNSRKKKKAWPYIGATIAFFVAILGFVGFFVSVPVPVDVAVIVVGVLVGCGLLLYGAIKKPYVPKDNPFDASLWQAEEDLFALENQLTQAKKIDLSALLEEKQQLLIEGQQHRIAAEKVDGLKGLLQEKKEEKARLEKRAWRLSTAKALLIEAKLQSTGGYLTPLAERCQDLFNKFYPQKAIVLTAEGEVRLDEAGALREGGYYSAGMRAALGICIRLALIEKIFDGETPPLILDDPFVDMDEENLRLAKSFLAALKNEYQIVYLTCHESRLL